MRLERDPHLPHAKPHRGLTALTVGLLAVGLALLLAAPAAAEHRRFRFGVFGQGFGQGDLVRMGDGNVRTLRTVFSWARVEKSRGSANACDAEYDWRPYDLLVASASQRGIRLLPVIVGSPGYVPGRPTNAPHTNSPAIHDYKCFVRALVARYGRGGEFARDHPAQPFRPVRSWQVWNEPNLRAFAARRRVAPRQYGRLLKATANQIGREDRRAKVVLAGMPEIVQGGMNARTFLTRLYRVNRIERKFDVVALHAFARNHRGVKGALIRTRRKLRRLGDRRRWLWVTETGWATGGPKDHYIVKTERGQARQLTKTFRMIRRNRKRFRVGSVHWFRWRDKAAQSNSGGWQRQAGLYWKDGTHKRSCNRFVKLTGGDWPCRGIPSQGSLVDSMEALEPRSSTARIVPSPPE